MWDPPPPLAGGETTAQRGLRMPLTLEASGIWSCDEQKNSEATRQDKHSVERTAQNYTLQISPSGGHPST